MPACRSSFMTGCPLRSTPMQSPSRPRSSTARQPVTKQESQFGPGRDSDRLVKPLPAAREEPVEKRAVNAEDHGRRAQRPARASGNRLCGSRITSFASIARSRQTSGSAGCARTQLGVVANMPCAAPDHRDHIGKAGTPSHPRHRLQSLSERKQFAGERLVARELHRVWRRVPIGEFGAGRQANALLIGTNAKPLSRSCRGWPRVALPVTRNACGSRA
jgi:hypothetical protein